MSFYQPSLSLYDVLNALSNQAPAARDPREQLFGSRGYAPQPYPSRSYGGGGLPSGLPAGLLYRLPGDTCYYRPDYYYTGEDEDEEAEQEEELEEAERAQRAQQQQQREYEQLPSYYHSRAPKGGVQEALEESDPLSELLGALIGGGGGGSSYEPGPSRVPSRRNTLNEEDLIKQTVLEKLGQRAQQEEENAAAAAAEGQDEQGKEQRQESQQPQVTEKESRLEEQATKPKEKLPFPLNKKPSLLGSQAGSSITGGPLQVSKPEARLDLPFSPELNVYDCPEQYVLAVALPGATSKAFKVDYHPSTHELILKGDIEDKLGIGEEHLKVTELKYGAFQRTIKFPITPRIKDEEIKASYKNGILQVKVPKILESNEKPAPKKRILIEDVPDEELEYEKHPGLSL